MLVLLHLTNVFLDGCTNITDASLQALAKSAGSKLTQLSVQHCFALSNAAGLLSIATHCTELSSLDLSYNSHSAAELSSSLSHCKQLRWLSLNGCDIDDSVLETIAYHMPLLEFLSICIDECEINIATYWAILYCG